MLACYASGRKTVGFAILLFRISADQFFPERPVIRLRFQEMFIFAAANTYLCELSPTMSTGSAPLLKKDF